MRHRHPTFCHHCNCERRFRRRQVDHIFHRRATLATFGLWSPVWLAAWMANLRQPWRCTACDERHRPGGEPRPAAPRLSTFVPV